ncbi:pentraxin-4 [Polypterus senegalus]|nr:pentraxin-4 [Polypterus senegalus]
MLHYGKITCFLLISACFCPSPGYLQEAVHAEHRKPFFERLRRLEEQFRRFQQMTLTRLQGIADNYNVSYNIDAHFQLLTEQYQNISDSINGFKATAENDLSSLKFWTRKLQKKSKKLDLKVNALEKAVNDINRQQTKDKKEQVLLLTNLTEEVQSQKNQITSLFANKDKIEANVQILQETVNGQRVKVDKFEEQVRTALQNDVVSFRTFSQQKSNETPKDKSSESPETPTKQVKKTMASNQKLHVKHLRSKQLQQKQQPPQPTRVDPTQETEIQPTTESLIKSNQLKPQNPTLIPQMQKISKNQEMPIKDGTICNVKSMLYFPNSSTDDYVTFKKGFSTGIHELSICTWLQVGSGYLGTMLSYATEENDNKLVLHGRNSTTQTSIHFVIGDPAYRELPVDSLLDGKWHHICLIWSSIEGKYWYYIDRRLVSTGSKFQKGYEITPGGSLVIGQEQDSMGGGFDITESFVGSLAGFAVWNQALTPGEVSGIVMGKGLPRGTIITLDDIAEVKGNVQHIACGCLEYCF